MSLSDHSSVKCIYRTKTIQVRYSHIQCSYVLKQKVMSLRIRPNRNLQGLRDPESYSLRDSLTSEHVLPTQLLSSLLPSTHIFSTCLYTCKSLLALGDGHYNRFNFHLKDLSPFQKLSKIQKMGQYVVRFPVTVNKCSSLQCLLRSQLTAIY